jgi:adenylosuccinate synthase
VALRYAAQINGMTEIAVTKLDILTGLERLNIAVGYNYKGERLNTFPQDVEVLARCEPIYEEMNGWREDVSLLRSYSELPDNTRYYLRRIEELVGVRVGIASVGPEREQLIMR